MSENPESVEAIREDGDVSLDEMTEAEREALEEEVAEMHRIAADNPQAGH